ncbi:MAG: biotin/lipoyl-binding protein [Chloroflexi bacterium]|jgi:acetyl-CoA carboxylase biotin carboxylase subunit|nr:biotin/lipoyl-binding protein [Chloroflexota bacterium]
MIKSLLIANRGEIACRIIHTCRRLGIRTVAVYSDADARARHVKLVDEAVHIGPSPATQSYLSISKILAAAHRTAVDAIHPGFGFLAENGAFARACGQSGVLFIGPPPQAIETMGDKRAARSLVASANLPLIPGYSDPDQSDQALCAAAQGIGYPVLIKASAGGGGKGMRFVDEPAQLHEALKSARYEANQAFGNQDLLLEKALPAARHVEFQIFADQHGHVIHLGERECSVQRRFQKVIEETPSPAITPALRAQMGAAAVAVARAVHYENGGTVEFLLDEAGRYYFLEMNTRLQVEHPITEMVTGIDLVEWQIRVAEGEALPIDQLAIRVDGHAVEARIYAENPARDFLPVSGEVLLWQEPRGEGIRVESGIQDQDLVSTHYDPMLVKIIAHGTDRATAVRRLSRALQSTTLLGITSNLSFLQDVLGHPLFQSGLYTTQLLAEHFAEWNDSQGDLSLALIVATLAQYVRHPQLESNQGYWRNNPNRPLRYRFAAHEAGEPLEVLLMPVPRTHHHYRTKLSIKPDVEQEVILFAYDAQSMSLAVNGYKRQVTIIAAGDYWWVKTHMGTVQLETESLLPQPHLAAGAGGSLRAPMPGSVLAVLVDEGQRVQEGQPLMKLEAMKMEHTIRSAAPGMVEAIYYAVGDTVEADAPLLSIREIED